MSEAEPGFALTTSKLLPTPHPYPFNNDNEDKCVNENHVESMKSNLLVALNRRFSFVKNSLPSITINPCRKAQLLRLIPN